MNETEQIIEELYCIGCGSKIQTDNKEGMGYLPSGALKKKIENEEELYCQRCFRLRHYNEIADVSLTDDDFLKLLTEIGSHDALIVNVIDIFDFNGSLIPGLHRFTSGNDVLLVANKKDILPHSLKVNKMKQWLKEQAHSAGLRPKDVVVTSAHNQEDVRELMTIIEKYRKGRDVYIVGVTNVGKSTLINAIIKVVTGDSDVITTSRFPGTTLDKIEIPLDEESVLVDTPGIIHRGQMAHYLEARDLKYVSPRKEIKPKTFQLNSEQTLFLGGLARFDYIQGEKQGITAYFDNELEIHRTKLAGATEFYDKHAGELLKPAVKGSKLIRKEFSIKEKSDLVITGLGWIRVAERGLVAVWAPEGVDILVRKALIG
ncbi:MAG: ribosome biogenesis GTPase YqeH [Streptococcaceae bacterium]|nr:ribosome biogenesis GTPase YqeH [Streptococcaceae bacterium]MCL2681555.1 ribosome biogenesis GTPase YqeH [Streptococcaceae bacterium]MCL2858709.1 ribosome biogenesis GTPase YqeH [Streptococcaceae bacterium]